MCLSIHLAVVSEIYTSWYQYNFCLDFSGLYFGSGDVGGHMVVVHVVTASRESAAEGKKQLHQII